MSDLRPAMTSSDNLSRRLGFGVGQRLRRVARRWRRKLHFDVWFPHIPLFVAAFLLGLLFLRHAVSVGLIGTLSTRNLLAASTGAITEVLDGAPSAVVGAFLVVMAFGLLARSRLAWAVALLGALASFLLVVLLWRGGPGRHVELLIYNGFVLGILLISGRSFSRSSFASATLFAIISTISLLTYAVLGSILLGQGFSPPIQDLVTAFYYTMVTMSTVGYGDIIPKTEEARVFAISVIVLGITVFATSLSALLVPMVSRQLESLMKTRERPVSRSNHYVVVSDSVLARNTSKELKARDQPITLILARTPEAGPQAADVVVGDATDLEVLRQAGAEEAKAILALGADDSENAFIVMAAKELSDRVKTVAVVNDARNMPRVQRVHPDLIIAPQVLGGELLAMALSGEKLESEHLMQQLLHFST